MEELTMAISNKKLLLSLGIAGNILWLAADIVLGYLPGGIAKSGFMSETATLEKVLSGAPLWRFPASAALCMLGMTLAIFGYLGIFASFKENNLLAKLTLLGGIGGSVCGAVYHVICTSSEWFYVRYGGGNEEFSALSDFMAQHEIPMRLCGGFLCLLGICLLISVLRGKTVFRKWCAVFNIMIFYPILMIFGYPGYMSMGGIIMFAGLLTASVKGNARELSASTEKD